MNEILILYFLTKSQNTMYGIAKMINKYFGYILSPSFGTLQPALKRMEKNGFLTSMKFFTTGGKLSFYYSVTPEGLEFLKGKLLEKLPKNPVQSYPEIKVKLACSDILDENDKKTLFSIVKTELLKLKNISDKILTSEIYEHNYFGKMVLDGSLCEYKNLLELTERLEKNACKS